MSQNFRSNPPQRGSQRGSWMATRFGRGFPAHRGMAQHVASNAVEPTSPMMIAEAPGVMAPGMNGPIPQFLPANQPYLPTGGLYGPHFQPQFNPLLLPPGIILSPPPMYHQPPIAQYIQPAPSGLPQLFQPAPLGLPQHPQPAPSGLPQLFQPAPPALPQHQQPAPPGFPQHPQPAPPALPQHLQPAPSGHSIHLPFELNLTPPENQIDYYTPEPGCVTSRRLVLEQVRPDQTIRTPWGWDVVSEKWVRLESFKNGFPTWPHHIFWGKFDKGAGEVVQVPIQRQIFFFKQIEFLCNINSKYLLAMAEPPAASSALKYEKITNTDMNGPTLPPFEVSQEAQGCRFPEPEEHLETDALPVFTTVQQLPEHFVSVRTLDRALQTVYEQAHVNVPPPQYSSSPRSGGPPPRATAAYCTVTRTFSEDRPGSDSEDERSQLSTGATESTSALLTALSIHSGGSETSHEEDEQRNPSTQSTEKETAQAANSASSVLSVASTQMTRTSRTSSTTIGSQKQMSLVEIISSAKATASSTSLLQEAETTVVRTPDSSEITPVQNTETRAQMEERQMAEMLAKDAVLQQIIKSSEDMWKIHTKQQSFIRNNPKSGSATMSDIMVSVWYHVFDENVKDWNDKSAAALHFAQQQVSAHRKSGNYRKYHQWLSVLEISPLPDVIIQDISYLEKTFKSSDEKAYKTQETRWFRAVFQLDVVVKIESLPKEDVPVDEDIYEFIELHQRLDVYVERQLAIREAAASQYLDALGCSEIEKFLANSHLTSHKEWNALDRHEKERIHKRIFEDLVETYFVMNPTHVTSNTAISARRIDVLRATDHLVVIFDAFILDREFDTRKEEERPILLNEYFLEVFKRLKHDSAIATGLIHKDSKKTAESYVIELPQLDANNAAKIDKLLENSLNMYIKRQGLIRRMHLEGTSLEQLRVTEEEKELAEDYVSEHLTYITKDDSEKHDTKLRIFHFLYTKLVEGRQDEAVLHEKRDLQIIELYLLAKAFSLLQNSDSEVIGFDAWNISDGILEMNREMNAYFCNWYYTLVFEHVEAKVSVGKIDDEAPQLDVGNENPTKDDTDQDVSK